MDQSKRGRDRDTTLQLKDDIDSGRTGSKVAAADPGLSPLGTDDEAGGRPTAPEDIAAARAQERRIGAIARAADKPRGFAPAAWMVVVIAVLAVVIVSVFMLHR